MATERAKSPEAKGSNGNSKPVTSKVSNGQVNKIRVDGGAMIVLHVLALAWLLVLSDTQKVMALLAATAYAGIEYSWYSSTTETGDGNVKFTPFAKTCRAGHTTWAQFWANVLYTPILISLYRALIWNNIVRIALFPLNVWLLEIVEGYLIIQLCGKNVAWHYEGKDALFNGNIKLGHFGLWLLLGIAVEIGYPIIHMAAKVIAVTIGPHIPLLGASIFTCYAIFHDD